MAFVIFLWAVIFPPPFVPTAAPPPAPAKNPDQELIQQLDLLQYLQMKKDTPWLVP